MPAVDITCHGMYCTEYLSDDERKNDVAGTYSTGVREPEHVMMNPKVTQYSLHQAVMEGKYPP
jgi:hypothetical protein